MDFFIGAIVCLIIKAFQSPKGIIVLFGIIVLLKILTACK